MRGSRRRNANAAAASSSDSALIDQRLSTGSVTMSAQSSELRTAQVWYLIDEFVPKGTLHPFIVGSLPGEFQIIRERHPQLPSDASIHDTDADLVVELN